MHVRFLAATAALATVSVPAIANQPAPVGTAAVVETSTAPVAAVPMAIRLAANTPVEMALNSGLSSKANATGEKFSLTVTQDVRADGQIVIPKGSRAVGLITYAKGNGSFGKSGKMELAFKYVELNGKQIPLEGTFYQEGEGNTAGTVGAVLAAGVIGGFVVKGHSANFVAGRDFSATIKQDVPFVALNGATSIEPSFDVGPISMRTETEKERKKRLKAAKKAEKAEAKAKKG